MSSRDDINVTEDGFEVIEGLDTKTMRVLLVDDDSDTRTAIARQLQPLGLNLMLAESGQEALVILKNFSIDLVISDLVMPHMSGMMLLHSMLEIGLHAPFILVTGYSDKDSAVQALRLGAFDYLEKPLDKTDLHSVVIEALKLSVEQRKILEVMRAHESKDEAIRNAETHIMKMRALRRQTQSFEPTVVQGTSISWQELNELFVIEAEPQLLFADGAMSSIFESDSISREIGFTLRIIQSVRMAAEAIRINDVATFAWAIETSLASCKSQAASFQPEHLKVLLEANHMLREKIATLSNPELKRVLWSLETLTDTMRDFAFKAKASAKAG